MYKFEKRFENIDWHTGPRSVPQTQTQTRASSNNKYRFEREIFPARNQNDFGHFGSLRDQNIIRATQASILMLKEILDYK